MTPDNVGPIVVAILILIALGIVILLISGVICLIKYFRTRRKVFLAVGLICTLLIPGLLFCGFIAWFLPAIYITYAPPPSNYIP